MLPWRLPGDEPGEPRHRLINLEQANYPMLD
jgi:hypothetical protein